MENKTKSIPITISVNIKAMAPLTVKKAKGWYGECKLTEGANYNRTSLRVVLRSGLIGRGLGTLCGAFSQEHDTIRAFVSPPPLRRNAEWGVRVTTQGRRSRDPTDRSGLMEDLQSEQRDCQKPGSKKLSVGL